jgi:transaldolase
MLFLDTANIEDVRRFWKWGCFKGITTNQKIFSMEKGIDYKQRIEELLKFKAPVSVELTSQNCGVEELVAEAQGYVADFGSEFLVIKVPMWKDGKGMEVASRLLEAGIKVNMTCLMNMNQVALACGAEATYASLFYNRMIDFYESRSAARQTIKASRCLIDSSGYKTKLICGSIRHPVDVVECLSSGTHIVTVTPQVLAKMPQNPKTDETIAEFDEAWRNWKCKK